MISLPSQSKDSELITLSRSFKMGLKFHKHRVSTAVVNGKTAVDITNVISEVPYITYSYKDKPTVYFQALAVNEENINEILQVSGREILLLNNRFYLTSQFMIFVLTDKTKNDYKELKLKYGINDYEFNDSVSGFHDIIKDNLEFAKTMNKLDEL